MVALASTIPPLHHTLYRGSDRHRSRPLPEVYTPRGIYSSGAFSPQGRLLVATIELTLKNFEEVVSSNDVVLIDFWAAWCAPCRAFAPTYEKVSLLYPNAVFAKVDTEAQHALAASLHIMAIPTLMIMRHTDVVFTRAGAPREKALVKTIEKVLAKDAPDAQRHTKDQ